MKRILSLVIALIFVCSMTGCNRQERAKKRIFDLVEKNYDAIVTACENKDADALLDIDGITKVEIVEGYVLVYCMGFGIAPSSQEYGFYYSEENQPVAVGMGYILCDTDDLIPEGLGYEYLGSDHNLYYTQRIKGKIFFYSAAY